MRLSCGDALRLYYGCNQGGKTEKCSFYGDGCTSQSDLNPSRGNNSFGCSRCGFIGRKGVIFLEMFREYFNAFWVGGLLCAIAQILIDKTKLTPARILVGFVVAGVILGGIGVYERIVDFAGAGATVPIIGFGNTLAQGVIKGLREDGILGIFTGGIKAAAGGISAAVIFGFLASVLFKPHQK